MHKFTGFILCLAIIAALPSIGLTDTITPITTLKGRPPAVHMVELPHHAFRLWYQSGQQKRAVLFIGANLGMWGEGEDYTKDILADAGKGKWADILAKDYPTTKFYAINRLNYLFFLCKSGVIDKIYWVPPSKDSVGKEPLDGFKEYLWKQGIDENELSNLKQDKNSIQGSLHGTPIMICGIKDLPEIKEELLMLIELPYFTTLYDNEIKTPLLDIYGNFIKALGSRKLKVYDAVISYSTAEGQVPLEFRFLGGYLRTYLSEPQRLKKGPPMTWELRSTAMHYETFFQTDDVIEAYTEAVKLDPDDASLRFALAMAYLNRKDLDGVRTELDKAVTLDNGYYPEYTEMGRYFQVREMPEDAEYFLSRAEKVNPLDPRIYSAQYSVYVSLKKYEKALEAVNKQMGLESGGPELLGQLAECEKALGHYAQAEKAYNDALAMIPVVDMQARQNLLAGLGETYDLDRKVELAIKTYKETLDTMAEGHAKDKIRERVNELTIKWSPFLNPSRQ